MLIFCGGMWQCILFLFFTLVNSLRPRLNRRPFADDIFKCVFLNENEWILPRISLKFVPKVRINNISSLVQIMAWRRPGDKPLSEPMMVSLLTHICVTGPQWVNWGKGPHITWHRSLSTKLECCDNNIHCDPWFIQQFCNNPDTKKNACSNQHRDPP